MVDHAKKAGVTSEKTMWESIDSFSELLEELKESHPKLYWEFMRKQHGIMFHNHYDESFASWDVSQMYYTDRQGDKHYGAYWTAEQIESATAGMKFPAGTTKWDKYVGFNAAKADFCKDFVDEDMIKIGYDFYYADEDWGSDTKVWEYMEHKPHKHE
jgi:hypothetical protein